MGMLSNARANTALTTKAYELVKVSHMEELDTGYNALIGECGHRLTVVNHTTVPLWEAKLAAPKSPRKRCPFCIKNNSAHQDKLAAESNKLSE